MDGYGLHMYEYMAEIVSEQITPFWAASYANRWPAETWRPLAAGVLHRTGDIAFAGRSAD